MPAKKLKTKRGRKQDAARISNQKSELKYAAKKAKKSQKSVRAAKKKVGVNRKKIMAELSGTTKTSSSNTSTITKDKLC